jgi:hypothetical protein
VNTYAALGAKGFISRKIPNQGLWAAAPVIIVFFAPAKSKTADLNMYRNLWRKENLACVRIFYLGSRRKTKDLDVACIRRERTRNQTWFTRDRSSIRQVGFLVAHA